MIGWGGMDWMGDGLDGGWIGWGGMDWMGDGLDGEGRKGKCK